MIECGGIYRARPILLYQGHGGTGLAEGFGLHSAALQTLEMEGGMSVRAGRRQLARIVRGNLNDELEFRVRSYSIHDPQPISVTFIVTIPEDWDNAEVYDTCTIYGRVLIRQYDDSSTSGMDDNGPGPGLAMLDIV